MDTFRTLALETARGFADFALGSLPLLGACVGIAALFVGPLWWIASAAGLL